MDPPPDPLRLAFCPRCDYSLLGSPDAGLCPECGTPYDQNFIVLYARPVMTGDQPNGTRVFSPVRLTMDLAAVALLISLVPTLHLANPVVFIGLGVGFVDTSLEAMTGLASLRRREVQLWIGPRGIGQRSTVDPESFTARGRVIFDSMGFGFAIAIVLPLVASGGRFGLLLVVVTVIAGPVAWVTRRGRRRRWILRPRGIRPGLLAWSAFATVHWEPRGPDRYELWAKRSPTLNRHDVIHVQLDLPAPAAKRLFAVLSQWSGGRVTVPAPTRASVKFTSASHTAGRRLRQLFVRKPPVSITDGTK